MEAAADKWQSKTAGGVRYIPQDSDVVAIESQADDELGAHAAIMISDDAAVFPPNTLFCLKEIKAPGEWKAPQLAWC